MWAAKAIRSQADALEQAAAALEADAERLQAQAMRRNMGSIKELKDKARQIPYAVAAAKASGANDPTGRAAASLGLPVETVQWYMRDHDIRTRAVKTKIRNREIARLAASGLTNAEIARRFGLHPKSVARIVRAARARPRP